MLSTKPLLASDVISSIAKAQAPQDRTERPTNPDCILWRPRRCQGPHDTISSHTDCSQQRDIKHVAAPAAFPDNFVDGNVRMLYVDQPVAPPINLGTGPISSPRRATALEQLQVIRLRRECTVRRQQHWQNISGSC